MTKVTHGKMTMWMPFSPYRNLTSEEVHSRIGFSFTCGICSGETPIPADPAERDSPVVPDWTNDTVSYQGWHVRGDTVYCPECFDIFG